MVDKKLKQLQIEPILSCKSSWEFSQKEECNDIVCKWQMMFQVLEYKRRNFLNLNNDNSQPIYLIYSKGGVWLKKFLSNLICTYITRLIKNHAPIGKSIIGSTISRLLFIVVHNDWSMLGLSTWTIIL